MNKEELQLQLETIIETSYEIYLNEMLDNRQTWFDVDDFAKRTAEYVADNHEELEGIDVVKTTTDYINCHGDEIAERLIDPMTYEENLRYEHPIN